MNLFTQLFAVCSISLRGLPHRAASSAVIVIGTAGVVAVLLSVLALSTGLAGTLTATGSPERAIVLHAQASNEFGSTLAHGAIATILDAPGIARDAARKPIASAEVLAAVNLARVDNGRLSALTLRGVSPGALQALRPELHIVQGRLFQSGLRELVVGRSAQERYAHLGVGSHVRFGENDWTVVGSFDSGGGAHDSEVLADADTVLAAYQRGTYNSVFVRLARPDALQTLRTALQHDRSQTGAGAVGGRDQSVVTAADDRNVGFYVRFLRFGLNGSPTTYLPRLFKLSSTSSQPIGVNAPQSCGRAS